MAGQKIARYEIVRELGKGAMGVVYEAVDPNIGRTVALKTMRLDVHGMESEDVLKRFRNEARAVGLLNHPNIVTIYDAGEFKSLFYIAMEFIQGVSLQERMRQGRLATEEIVEITAQICAGLDYAHGKGVIHRDVKPANIMLAGPAVKIMDFGIAKAGNATVTGTGQVLGTPNYMAPEQVRGKPLDGRSDLFSVGVMLYEMITGERPFTGENVTTIVYKIVHDSPIPPVELDPTIHAGLNAVVLKALQKSPDLRFQNCTELAKALQSYRSFAEATVPIAAVDAPTRTVEVDGTAAAASGSMAARPAMGGAAAAVEMAPAPAASRPAALPRPIPKGGKSGMPFGLIAALAVVVFAFAAAGYWKYHHRSSTAARTGTTGVTATEPAVPPALTEENSSSSVAGRGELRISTQPTGALIALDDRHDLKWIAPFTFTALKPGAHKVAVEMEGYKTETRSLNVDAGKRVSANIEMVLNKGYLEVATDPPGAAILLDGQSTGQVTPGKLPLDPGPHRLALRLDGYKQEATIVDVGVAQVLTISPKLTKLPTADSAASGSDAPFDAPEQPVGINPLGRVKRLFSGFPAGRGILEVRTRPRGADVWINNKFQVPARTPVRLPIKPGTYTVTARIPGYKAYNKTVQVKQGDVVSVDAQLDKIGDKQ